MADNWNYHSAGRRRDPVTASGFFDVMAIAHVQTSSLTLTHSIAVAKRKV